MGKIYDSFQTRPDQKPYPFGSGRHIPIWIIWGSTLWVLNEAKNIKILCEEICRSRRMPNNNSLQIGIILHSIRKLDLIIVLLLIQNISILNKHISSWTFFTTLSYFLARLRLKQTFFLEDTPYSKKQIIYVLRILAFLPFSFSQKFGSFIFGYPRTMIMNNNCK